MRNTNINSESNKASSQQYSNFSAFYNTKVNKPNVPNQLYSDGSHKSHFQKPKETHRQPSIEQIYHPQSIYENYSLNSPVSGEKTLPVRRSRLFNSSLETTTKKLRPEMKRDLSMPPISAKQNSIVDRNTYSPYTVDPNHIKYSIDLDLDVETNDANGSPSCTYDSIASRVSNTPPPVHILSSTSTSEYVNRKAIIRPLAFRPIQPDQVPTSNEPSPTKPPVATKNKAQKRISPPPVPPHASRMSTKTNLYRVQSAKSGDSSGYYSSRATGTLTGTVSSAEISPTFDESISMHDTFPSSDIYSNVRDLRGDNDDQIRQLRHDREDDDIKFSLESEIISERQRSKILEASLTNSNCKLLDAEGHIIELKKRLSQKSNELGKAVENLELIRRNLEHQFQKSAHLEKTVQSLKLISKDKIKDHDLKDQCTQTIQCHSDFSTNKLLDQFEEERKTWLTEKCKVLTYQRQIESNFQQLLIKHRRLEAQVLKTKNHLKDNRGKQYYAANHCEDHDKSSSASIDSSHRSYLTNVSRIEVTEHQSSF